MLHFYNTPPVTAEEIHARLLPGRTLQSSGIPFVVFGEDALAFVHFVPTVLFDFTLLVPDDLVQDAVKHIQQELPQYQVTQERSYQMMNDNGLCALPRAVRLQWDETKEKVDHTPGAVLVVPQSHFHFDVEDTTRSCGVILPFDAGDAQIRFPTMPAFLDAIIDTMFEPVDGVSHLEFRTSYLAVFLSYLVLYNVREEDGPTDPDTEELLPAAEALLEGVKLENIPFLDTFMRTGSTKLTPDLRAERKRAKKARLATSLTDRLSFPSQIRGIPSPSSSGRSKSAGGGAVNGPNSRSFSTQYRGPAPTILPFQAILRTLRTKRLLR